MKYMFIQGAPLPSDSPLPDGKKGSSSRIRTFLPSFLPSFIFLPLCFSQFLFFWTSYLSWHPSILPSFLHMHPSFILSKVPT